jgi:hypothetical protein
MTQGELKELTNLGAELGAAKAENDRLRGLLDGVRKLTKSQRMDNLVWSMYEGRIKAALSQQAEPQCLDCLAYQENEQNPNVVCDECGWKQSELAEPAPAHDERKTFEVEIPDISAIYDGRSFIPYRSLEAGERLMTVAQHLRIEKQLRAALTRPAQTEQQPPYPHEAMDVIATSRYQVVASGSGPLSRYYVRAGDGKCELYRGGKSDCEHVARKLAGAFLDGGLTAFGLYAAPIAQTAPQGKFRMGDLVKKSTGSEWEGHICGTYSTELTPEGYAVESSAHRNSVQIYPAKALEAVDV